MSKKLTEMTNEELWRLFPIYFTEHKPYWSDWYAEEVGYLRSILPQNVQFYHVGSTAVARIMAKPIIDILIVVDSAADMVHTSGILQAHEYLVMSTGATRISLNKGYTQNGYAERVFHIHLRLQGDVDEIYFKDYLNAHADIAAEYEKLKLQLLEKHKFNRDAYTYAKTDFVKKYTLLAKKAL